MLSDTLVEFWAGQLLPVCRQQQMQHFSQEVGLEHDARRRRGRFTGGGVVSARASV